MSGWNAKEIAEKLTELQRDAIYWLDDDWQAHEFNEQLARLWWNREAVLLRPAIIEHRIVRHYVATAPRRLQTPPPIAAPARVWEV